MNTQIENLFVNPVRTNRAGNTGNRRPLQDITHLIPANTNLPANTAAPVRAPVRAPVHVHVAVPQTSTVSTSQTSNGETLFKKKPNPSKTFLNLRNL